MSLGSPGTARFDHPVFEALVGAGACFKVGDLLSRTLFVGFSGGLDSSVLTHALAQVMPPQGVRLKAIHVNHRLQPAAMQFERHCREVAELWGLSLAVKRPAQVRGQAQELGLEASARLRRYAAFEQAMGLRDESGGLKTYRPADSQARQHHTDTSQWPVLLLAHHANDQVETALLQWMRGAGLEGLTAMPVLSQRVGYFLWRPLLSLTRTSLEDYAGRYKLPFIEDPSNTLLDQDRNRLRQQIFPVLNAMRPGAISAMTRSLQHLQQARGLLEQLDQEDLTGCVQPEGLSLAALLNLSEPRQLRTLRAWLVSTQRVPGTSMPPARRLKEFLRQLRTARVGRSPVLAVTAPSTGGVASFRVRLRAGFLTVEWI
ncbi:MAG: tRNA lysidine(34) synthetase TilS [Burkholderiaceae bacterium]